MSQPSHQPWEDEPDDGSIVSSFSSRATATTDAPSSNDSDSNGGVRGRLAQSGIRRNGGATGQTSIFGTSAKDYNRSKNLVLGGGPSVGGISGAFGISPPRNMANGAAAGAKSVLDDDAGEAEESNGLGSFEELPISANSNLTAFHTGNSLSSAASGSPMLHLPQQQQQEGANEDRLMAQSQFGISAFGSTDALDEPPAPSLFTTLQQVEEQRKAPQQYQQQQQPPPSVDSSIDGYRYPRSSASAATMAPTAVSTPSLAAGSYSSTAPQETAAAHFGRAVEHQQLRSDNALSNLTGGSHSFHGAGLPSLMLGAPLNNRPSPAGAAATMLPTIEGVPYYPSPSGDSSSGAHSGSPLNATAKPTIRAASDDVRPVATTSSGFIAANWRDDRPSAANSELGPSPTSAKAQRAGSNNSSTGSYPNAPPELHQTMPIDARPPSQPLMRASTGLPPTHPNRHPPQHDYGDRGQAQSPNYDFASPSGSDPHYSSPDANHYYPQQPGYPRQHSTEYDSSYRFPDHGQQLQPPTVMATVSEGKHKHRHRHDRDKGDRDHKEGRKKDKRSSGNALNGDEDRAAPTASPTMDQRHNSVRGAGGVSVAGGGSVAGGIGHTNRNRSIQWGGGSQYGGTQSLGSASPRGSSRKPSNLAGMVTIESSSGGLGRQNVFGGTGGEGLNSLAFGGNLAASDRFGAEGAQSPRGPQSMSGGGRWGGSSAGQVFPYNSASNHHLAGLGSSRAGGSVIGGASSHNRFHNRSDSGRDLAASQHGSGSFQPDATIGSGQGLGNTRRSVASPIFDPNNTTNAVAGGAKSPSPHAGSVQGSGRRNYIGIAGSTAPSSASKGATIVHSSDHSLALQYILDHKKDITPATVGLTATAAIEADEAARKQVEEDEQKSKRKTIGAAAGYYANNLVSGVADLFKVADEEEDIMERRGRDAGRQYSDGYHLIPWDQRSTIPISDDNNDSCSCWISPRFWERVDWALRCTLLCVLPTSVLTLLGSVNGRPFVLPGVTIVMALWVSQPTLGRGLRELYLAIKGGIPAYVISILLVWIHPNNQWFWLGLFVVAVFFVALVSDEIKKPCCFFIACSFGLYQITDGFTYSMLTNLYVDILIGLAMGSCSFFIWKINWALDRAKNHVVVLGNTAAVSIAGICSSFWTNSRLDRELNLVRIRQLKHTSARALAVIELSLNDASFEPHNTITIQRVRARRNLLHQIMGVINSTSNFIEVIADNPQWISTESCEAMGKCLNTDLSVFGAAMDSYLLRICDFDKPVRLHREGTVPAPAAMSDDPKANPAESLPGIDKSLFLAARDKFNQSVEVARQQVMLEDKNFKPSQSDIMLGFFLCSVDQMAEMLLKFEEPDLKNEESGLTRALKRPYEDLADSAMKLYQSGRMLAKGRIPRDVKESIKLALAMGLSCLVELVTNTLDPLSGATLIPWVYAHDGLGTYNLMLMRVLGTVFGSIISFMGAELVNQDVAGVLCLITLFTLCGAFVQTSGEFSAAGNAFIWGVVSIAAKFDLRDVAIDRFTANVIAVLIYFFVSFVIWPNRMTTNIKEHLEKSLKAFRQATILLVKGIDDTPVRRYFKLVDGQQQRDREQNMSVSAGYVNNGPDALAEDINNSPPKPKKRKSRSSGITNMSIPNEPANNALTQFRDRHQLQIDGAPQSIASGEADEESTDSEESSEMFDFATDYLPNADLILIDSHNEVDEFNARIRDQELSIPSCVKEPTMTTSAFPEDQWVKLVRCQKNLYHLLSLLRFSYETFAKSHVIGDSESIHWGLLGVMRVAAMDIGNMIFASVDLHLLMLEKITKVPTHFLVRLRGALVERQKQMEEAFLAKLGDLLGGVDTGEYYVEGAGFNFDDKPELPEEPEDGATNIFKQPSFMGGNTYNAPDGDGAVFKEPVDDDGPNRPASPTSPLGASALTNARLSPAVAVPMKPFPQATANEPIAEVPPLKGVGNDPIRKKATPQDHEDDKEMIEISPARRTSGDPLHDASDADTDRTSGPQTLREDAAVNNTAVFGPRSTDTARYEPTKESNDNDAPHESPSRLLKHPQAGLVESRGPSLQPQQHSPPANRKTDGSPPHSFASSQFIHNASIFGPASSDPNLSATRRSRLQDLNNTTRGDFSLPIQPETPAPNTTLMASSPATIAKQAEALKALNEARVAAYTEQRKANKDETAKRLAKEEERREAAALASGVGGVGADSALKEDKQKNLMLGREAFQLAQIQKQRQREAKAILGNLSFLGGNASILGGVAPTHLGATVNSSNVPGSALAQNHFNSNNTFVNNSSMFYPSAMDNTSMFDRTTFLQNFTPSVIAAYNNLPAGEPITNQSFTSALPHLNQAGTHLAAPSALGHKSNLAGTMGTAGAATVAPFITRVAAEDVATILGSTASTFKAATHGGATAKVDGAAAMAIADADGVAVAASGGSKITAMANSMRNKKQSAEQNVYNLMAQQLGIPPGLLRKKLAETRRMLALGGTATAFAGTATNKTNPSPLASPGPPAEGGVAPAPAFPPNPANNVPGSPGGVVSPSTALSTQLPPANGPQPQPPTTDILEPNVASDPVTAKLEALGDEALNKAIKVLVLSNGAIHSIEAFIFGVHALIQELGELEKGLLEMQHVEEINEML